VGGREVESLGLYLKGSAPPVPARHGERFCDCSTKRRECFCETLLLKASPHRSVLAARAGTTSQAGRGGERSLRERFCESLYKGRECFCETLYKGRGCFCETFYKGRERFCDCSTKRRECFCETFYKGRECFCEALLVKASPHRSVLAARAGTTSPAGRGGERSLRERFCESLYKGRECFCESLYKGRECFCETLQ